MTSAFPSSQLLCVLRAPPYSFKLVLAAPPSARGESSAGACGSQPTHYRHSHLSSSTNRTNSPRLGWRVMKREATWRGCVSCVCCVLHSPPSAVHRAQRGGVESDVRARTVPHLEERRRRDCHRSRTGAMRQTDILKYSHINIAIHSSLFFLSFCMIRFSEQDENDFFSPCFSNARRGVGLGFGAGRFFAPVSGREPGCVAGARRRCWDCARELESKDPGKYCHRRWAN